MYEIKLSFRKKVFKRSTFLYHILESFGKARIFLATIHKLFIGVEVTINLIKPSSDLMNKISGKIPRSLRKYNTGDEYEFSTVHCVN